MKVEALANLEGDAGAVLSEDGRYRYLLWRTLPPSLLQRVSRTLLVVMLNPSTADAETNDRTILRVLGYAEREGFRVVLVVNLYALRDTDPQALLSAQDPVGPACDKWIAAAATGADAILVAWGGGPKGPFDLRPRVDAVREILRQEGFEKAHCFGLTKDGQPLHPLYLSKTLPFQDYPLQDTAHG